MQPLFGAGEADDKRWILESQLLWGVAARALNLGVNVVLDYGCWARDEREYFRQSAESCGARVELLVIDTPLDELWRRLEVRNANLPPGTFPISRADLELWSSWFQRPSIEELSQYTEHTIS